MFFHDLFNLVLSSLQTRNKLSTLSDCNWTRTQNHLVLKRTLNHLAKLAKRVRDMTRTYSKSLKKILNCSKLQILFKSKARLGNSFRFNKRISKDLTYVVFKFQCFFLQWTLICWMWTSLECKNWWVYWYISTQQKSS